jgi:hypothetical protein
MFCAKLALLNIHIEVLIGQFYNRRNRINYFVLYEIMCSCAVKIFIKPNNLIKQQFLTHLTYVLCKINVVEYSYRSFNWTTL